MVYRFRDVDRSAQPAKLVLGSILLPHAPSSTTMTRGGVAWDFSWLFGDSRDRSNALRLDGCASAWLAVGAAEDGAHCEPQKGALRRIRLASAQSLIESSGGGFRIESDFRTVAARRSGPIRVNGELRAIGDCVADADRLWQQAEFLECVRNPLLVGDDLLVKGRDAKALTRDGELQRIGRDPRRGGPVRRRLTDTGRGERPARRAS